MPMIRRSVILAAFMGLAAVAGIAARPTHKATEGPAFSLEEVVPRRFGDWHEIPSQMAQVVNPQTQELLDRLYSQVLTRTYVNASGYRIMLSLAYGDDQRGGLAAHKPEVCYPAQGFALQDLVDGVVATPYGDIPARRLKTSLGARHEPVTYWFNLGDTPVRTTWQQRMVELRLGLSGQIPDGLLFRVSSIDDTAQRAWHMQDAFVVDMMKSLGPKERARLSGLRAPPA